MLNRLYLIIYMLAASLLLTACGAERNVKKGDAYFALGEYYDAANQYRTAYQRTPPKERDLRGQRAAKMAMCYDYIGESQRAIAAYRNVIRYKQDDAQREDAAHHDACRDGDKEPLGKVPEGHIVALAVETQQEQ